MARQMSEEKKRENTRKNLVNLLSVNGKIEQVFLDKIDEYMSFYDNLKEINEYLKALKSGENMQIKLYTEAVREKRMLSAEMRSILTYLGIKTEESKGGITTEKL